MPVHATIEKDGRVTLPPEIMDAAHARPGDDVTFEVTEPNMIVVRVQPGGSPDDGRTATTANAPVDYDSLPILTLDELLERYRIEGPVDLEADREALYDEMAKDVFGERPDRFPS